MWIGCRDDGISSREPELELPLAEEFSFLVFFVFLVDFGITVVQGSEFHSESV